MKIIYEFKPYDDSEELKLFQDASNLRSTIWDIQKCIKALTSSNLLIEEFVDETDSYKTVGISFSEDQVEALTKMVYDNITENNCLSEF